MLRRVYLLYIVVCACASPVLSQQYSTLGQLLQRAAVPIPPASIPHLQALVTSYAVLDDTREFVIGYYLADPQTQILRPPLFVTRYSKAGGDWSHVAIESSEVLQASKLKDWSVGSVLEINRTAHGYYLQLHWTPSAGCLLILDDDLNVVDALAGGPLGWFKSGAILYTKNMIHFADVHPETLWLYDSVTRESKQLYPQPGDPLRDAFSARLAKIVDDQRCRKRNWACDPQNFASDIAEVHLNDDTGSFAAHISFETEGFLDRYEAEDSGQWDDDDYVYIYQLQPFRWREFLIYDLKPKFGTDSLKDLLTPTMIEKVFAAPAP